jgi:uncharacterized protein YigE (DUF2233 family)
MARTWVRHGRPADVAAVGALLAYAVLVGLLVLVPLGRRLTEPAASAASTIPVFTSLPEEAQQLVLAPKRNTEAERSSHILREWRLVGGVGVNIVTVNPRADNVRIGIGLAKGTILSEDRFGRENFRRMVERLRPRVAINGTYFHLRNNEPVGALVMEGVLIYDGLCSSSLIVADTGEVHIEHHGLAYGRHIGWPVNVRTAVCSGPTLVDKGHIHLDPYDEGFGDPAIFFRARRSAVGVTAEGKMLLVTVETPITWNKLANIMLQLGATEAMNLDGGGSSALYSNGQFITQPQRPLTNLLLVYD